MNRRSSGKSARSSTEGNTSSEAAARLADYTGAQATPLAGQGQGPSSGGNITPAAPSLSQQPVKAVEVGGSSVGGSTMPDVADVTAGIHDLSSGSTTGGRQSSSTGGNPATTPITSKEPLKVSMPALLSIKRHSAK